MTSSRSPLRVASNLLVIILILALVAYGIDAALVWYGTEPIITCTVLPAWLELSDPWGFLLAFVALLLWGLTREPAACLFFLVCLMLGVLPWLFVTMVNPTCG